MMNNKKVAVILPRYNASTTLHKTYNKIPFHIIDKIVLVDDKSEDHTLQVSKKLGIKHIIEHQSNKGYGANQKTCYKKALSLGADIVIMLHPD